MRVELRRVRGQWTVWYQDEMQLPMTIPVYDRDGNYKERLVASSVELGESPRYVMAHFEGSKHDAEEFARYLGATEIEVVKPKARKRKVRG